MFGGYLSLMSMCVYEGAIGLRQNFATAAAALDVLIISQKKNDVGTCAATQACQKEEAAGSVGHAESTNWGGAS